MTTEQEQLGRLDERINSLKETTERILKDITEIRDMLLKSNESQYQTKIQVALISGSVSMLTSLIFLFVGIVLKGKL